MNVYIKAQESVCLVHPEIKIKDIMSLYCTDKDLEQKIKNQSVYHFIGDYDQRKCFSVLMLVEVIKQVDKTLDVINLGAEDFIVYYKRKQEESKIFHYGKIVFVILVAFFGASFSIMTYNTDVGIEELFYNVYEMIMGQAPDGPNILHISYAAGLAIGIILFFNHAGKINSIVTYNNESFLERFKYFIINCFITSPRTQNVPPVTNAFVQFNRLLCFGVRFFTIC